MSRRSAFVFLLVLAVAVPAAAQKRAFTLEDLYRIEGLGDVRIAPDGASVLYTLTRRDLPRARSETQLWAVAPDGSNARQLTFHERGAQAPAFSPDGRWIAFVSARDGHPNLYLLPRGGGEARQLTRITTGVSDPVWSPDSRWIVFASDVYPECGADEACNARIADRWRKGPLAAHMADALLYRHWTDWKDGTRTHLLLVNVETGALRDLTPGDHDSPPFQLGGPVPYDFSPDSAELCFVSKRVPDPASSTNSDLFILPLGDPQAQPRNITASNPAFDGSPRYSPDGRYIAYRLQRQPGYESDRFRLAIFDRRQGTTRELAGEVDNWVEALAWAPDSASIYFQVDEQGRTPIYRADLAGGARQVLVHATIDDWALTPRGDALIYISRAVGSPAELYRADLGGAGASAPRALTAHNADVAAEVDIRPADELWVPGAGGRKVHVFLVKPHGFDPGRKYPLILNVHGGPQQQWTDGFRGDWQVYPGAGYIVAFANPHGSTGYGQAYTAQISHDWGGAVFEDLMKVTDALAALPYVDADRMGAMGWSYGGYMMNWFAGRTTRFKALASMMGVFDLRSFYGATEELWFPEWDLGGTPWTSPLYERWSPSALVPHFKTPMLVLTGERDYRVPYTQSLQLFTALQKMGVPSRLIVFSNAGHWPGWYEMALYYTAHLEWFQRYLGGGGPPWSTEAFLRNAVFDRETGQRIDRTPAPSGGR